MRVVMQAYPLNFFTMAQYAFGRLRTLDIAQMCGFTSHVTTVCAARPHGPPDCSPHGVGSRARQDVMSKALHGLLAACTSLEHLCLRHGRMYCGSKKNPVTPQPLPAADGVRSPLASPRHSPDFTVWKIY